MPIYLAFSPEESSAAAASGRPLACMGYQLSADSPALLAPDPVPETACRLLLQDSTTPSYEPTEALAQLVAQYAAAYHTGVICDLTTPGSPFWQSFTSLLNDACSRVRLPLWVPAAYAAYAPGAWVIVGSDVTEGRFSDRLADAAARWPNRCVLELLPLCCRLPLPCPSGGPEPLTPEALRQAMEQDGCRDFPAEELLCRCCAVQTGGPAALLFDTRETLQAKLSAAEAAGFRAAVGLQQELLPMLQP